MGRRRQDGGTESADSPPKEPVKANVLGGTETDWSSERVAVVDEIIVKLEHKLTEMEVTANIGDYIRLIQVRKDLGDGFQGEVRASWVGS